MSPLEKALEDYNFQRWLDAGTKALQAQEAKEITDEVDALVREGLEKLYAAELAAVVTSKTSPNKKYVAAWTEYCAWLRDQGVPHLPPRPTACARYMHEQLEAGADEAKIKLVRAALGWAYTELREFDPTSDELVRAVAYRDWHQDQT
jgi:hypothetical protein